MKPSLSWARAGRALLWWQLHHTDAFPDTAAQQSFCSLKKKKKKSLRKTWQHLSLLPPQNIFWLILSLICWVLPWKYPQWPLQTWSGWYSGACGAPAPQGGLTEPNQTSQVHLLTWDSSSWGPHPSWGEGGKGKVEQHTAGYYAVSTSTRDSDRLFENKQTNKKSTFKTFNATGLHIHNTHSWSDTQLSVQRHFP